MKRHQIRSSILTSRIALVAIVLQAFCGSAVAKLVFYDGFVAGSDPEAGEYVANPGSDSSGRYKLQDGQDPQIDGFTGSWKSRTAPWDFRTADTSAPLGSLSYEGVNSTGNAVFRRWQQGASYRKFDKVMQKGGDRVMYVSFLFQLTDPTAQARIEFSREETSTRSGVGLDFNYLVDGEITPYGSFENGRLATAPDDKTHLVVIKFELSDKADRYTIWYDPANLLAEEGNEPFHRGVARSLDLNYLILERYKGGTANYGVVFDELRISTSWDEDLFQGTLE